MAWVYLLPDDGIPNIVTFDSTISETHDRSAVVTAHPIEDGSEIMDHVIDEPFSFSCEVYVSNTPIEDLGRGSVNSVSVDLPTNDPPLRIQALEFPEEFDRIKETNDALQALTGKSMSVVTSVRTYDKMVLVNASLPRTEYGGAGFQLGFKQVKTVETKTVKAPEPVEPRGAPGQNKGAQGTKKPNGKDKDKASFAVKALQSAGILK